MIMSGVRIFIMGVSLSIAIDSSSYAAESSRQQELDISKPDSPSADRGLVMQEALKLE